jgi:hypothetical protein
MRTSIRRPAVLAAAALAAVALARPASAQTTHFGAGGRATFNAAANTPVTNDLNSGGPTYGFGALGTGTVTGNGIATINGRIFATGGGIPTPAFTVTFSNLLGAFGADFTGLGTINTDFPFPAGEARFTFYNGATTVGTVAQNFGLSGAETFFGVIGAPSTVAPPPAVVPEPATVALVGAGLAAVLGVARRRSTSMA